MNDCALEMNMCEFCNDVRALLREKNNLSLISLRIFGCTQLGEYPIFSESPLQLYYF